MRWRTVRGLAVVVAVIGLAGCVQQMASFIVLACPWLAEKQPAEFDLAGRTVTLKVTPANEIEMRDLEGVRLIEKRLWEQMEANVGGIDLAPMQKVRDYQTAHQDYWDDAAICRLGRHTTADLVVELRLDVWQLRGDTDLGRHARQGRASGTVRVHEMQPACRSVWATPLDLTYPPGSARIVDDAPIDQFRQEMVEYIVANVASLFHKHRGPGAD